MKILSGIDLVQISEFKKQLESSAFVKRIFNESELENKSVEHLAGIFAAKEAFFKATQINIKKWTDIQVTHKKGKPHIKYVKRDLKIEISSMDCSISHTGDYAVAIVVIISC